MRFKAFDFFWWLSNHDLNGCVSESLSYIGSLNLGFDSYDLI